MSDADYLPHCGDIATEDEDRCHSGYRKYGPSWCKRGGTGVFHVGLARKWDRIEKQLEDRGYDVWEALRQDPSPDGIIDDLRDLRTYLLLVEAKARAMGICPPLKDGELTTAHRDNATCKEFVPDNHNGGTLCINCDLPLSSHGVCADHE